MKPDAPLSEFAASRKLILKRRKISLNSGQLWEPFRSFCRNNMRQLFYRIVKVFVLGDYCRKRGQQYQNNGCDYSV